MFEQVSAQFSEAEIVELTLVCGMFNLFNRLADSLHIDITEYDVDRIKGLARTDPDVLKGYLQSILDTWPDSFPEPSDD